MSSRRCVTAKGVQTTRPVAYAFRTRSVNTNVFQTQRVKAIFFWTQCVTAKCVRTVFATAFAIGTRIVKANVFQTQIVKATFF